MSDVIELLSRCTEIARQLRDIGEEQHANDVTELIQRYVTELGAVPLGPGMSDDPRVAHE